MLERAARRGEEAAAVVDPGEEPLDHGGLRRSGSGWSGSRPARRAPAPGRSGSGLGGGPGGDRAVGVVHAAVAGAEEQLRLGDPAHRAAEMGAVHGVGGERDSSSRRSQAAVRAVTPAQGSGDASSKRTLTVSPTLNSSTRPDRPPHARLPSGSAARGGTRHRQSQHRTDRGGKREGDAGQESAPCQLGRIGGRSAGSLGVAPARGSESMKRSAKEIGSRGAGAMPTYGHPKAWTSAAGSSIVARCLLRSLLPCEGELHQRIPTRRLRLIDSAWCQLNMH